MTSTKYIGMDVHKESISIAVMNCVGKVVMECVIETKASTIVQFLDGLRGDLRVTLEEGTWAAWLYDLLKPHVTEVAVCNPRKAALLKDGSKSDRIDAHKLAELLKMFMDGWADRETMAKCYKHRTEALVDDWSHRPRDDELHGEQPDEQPRPGKSRREPGPCRGLDYVLGARNEMPGRAEVTTTASPHPTTPLNPPCPVSTFTKFTMFTGVAGLPASGLAKRASRGVVYLTIRQLELRRGKPFYSAACFNL